MDEPKARRSSKKEKDKRIVKVIVAKQRNGLLAMSPFKYNPDDLDYEDLFADNDK